MINNPFVWPDDSMARSKKAIVGAFLPPFDWFDRWWEPLDFLDAVRLHTNPVPAHLLLTHPALGKLREALAAARFCVISGQGKSLKIRLEGDRFPDFQIMSNGKTQHFELAEAVRPRPNLSREIQEAAAREAAGLPPIALLFDPDEEERAALSKIQEVLAGKAAKKYRPAPHLLIYVNFFLFRELPITSMQADQIVSPYRDVFLSTWLLWGNSVGRLWPRPCKIVDRNRIARW